jgi:hypothetical protein
MTKDEELGQLKAFIAILPQDSYLRPWLESELPAVTAAISNDLCPGLAVIGFTSWQAIARDQAKREDALVVREAAILKAERRLADADKALVYRMQQFVTQLRSDLTRVAGNVEQVKSFL